jgi:hypothetical protein
MPKSRDQWTVVQHSGFGYSRKPGFAKGLETRRVVNASDRTRIEKAGGLLLSYSDAENYADRNVGPGLYPAAPGKFSKSMVDGLRIYIPPAPAEDAGAPFTRGPEPAAMSDR